MALRHFEVCASSEPEGEEGSRAPYDPAARLLDRDFLLLVQNVGVDDDGMLIQNAQLPKVYELARAGHGAIYLALAGNVA